MFYAVKILHGTVTISSATLAGRGFCVDAVLVHSVGALLRLAIQVLSCLFLLIVCASSFLAMLVLYLNIPKPNSKYCKMENHISIQVHDRCSCLLDIRQQFAHGLFLFFGVCDSHHLIILLFFFF